MDKESIINDLKINNRSGYKTRELYFKKTYPTEYLLINSIESGDDWYEKLYCYLNNIETKPTCFNCDCNNHVNFNRYSEGYYTYCSVSCKNTDKLLINANKNKFIENFGVDNPMKVISIRNKAAETKEEKYGNRNYVNIEKAKKTKKIKYDDENYNNRKKASKTSELKYGVSNYTNREQAKATSKARYGTEYYNNREKHYQTNLTNHGIKCYNNREKAEITSLLKYGETTYTKTNEHKNLMLFKSINKLANKLNLNVDNIDYNGSDFTVHNYCTIHNEFIINKYVLKNRIKYGISNICTLCNPISEQASIKEKEVNDYISNTLNIKTIKYSINNKEIDIYLPEHKLGIEFNGLYWHSHINVSKTHHIEKTELCERNDIVLLHVFENEWINKRDIVKSIIKSKLNLFDEKIFARKCLIKEVDNVLSREFIDNNHIQGNVGAKIKLGLYYNDELVTIMTFGKKRVAMGNKTSYANEYEMIRFCNKLNTRVIGGASKLLSYFIKKYAPSTILTFADRRYSQGNLYRQLGFSFIGNTEPNYWYFKSHEYVLYHRFKFRKDVLVKEGYDSTKTEHQIMDERKYYRIYDSGHMKFELKLV